MSNPLYAFPAVCEQTLRALARYPERTAFSWPGGSITYRGATDMIGRIQSVFMQLGFAPGTRVAFLTAYQDLHSVRFGYRAWVEDLEAEYGFSRAKALFDLAEEAKAHLLEFAANPTQQRRASRHVAAFGKRRLG